MIAIIDYGAGNLRNIECACLKIQMDVVVTKDPAVLDKATALILPGVGAFGDAMRKLEEWNLSKAIRRSVSEGKYLLGICLGMQLLFEDSEEQGHFLGFGFIPGSIRRIKTPYKVPHVGWNQLIIEKEHPILRGISNGDYVYYVHSYCLDSECRDNILCSSEYGGLIPSIVAKDRLIGMQFHPEKSGKTGEQLLKNFKELVS